jgi:hypothetical protein
MEKSWGEKINHGYGKKRATGNYQVVGSLITWNNS